MCALCLLVAASPLSLSRRPAGRSAADREAANLALQQAEDLYKAGDYQGCAGIVEGSIADSEAGRALFPKRTMARIRVLDALIAYTFRDAGYEERVSRSLKTALTLDLNVEVGEPAEVPPYILERFALIKKEYMAGFTRSARRNTIGLVGAIPVARIIAPQKIVYQRIIFRLNTVYVFLIKNILAPHKKSIYSFLPDTNITLIHLFLMIVTVPVREIFLPEGVVNFRNHK